MVYSNNRKVISLTQIGSLGTLVMSASSSTPTITVGNSHFFTGQKKSLKHPSMLRQQKPLKHFQACSLKQKHLLQHTSMQTLFHTFHTRCMRQSAEGIYLSKICPSMSRNIPLLTTEAAAHTQLVPQSVKEIMHYMYI